jgi:hypothetical protein
MIKCLHWFFVNLGLPSGRKYDRDREQGGNETENGNGISRSFFPRATQGTPESEINTRH